MFSASRTRSSSGNVGRAGYVSFVREGAVLPRQSGANDRPMRQGVVPFKSPESLRVSMKLKSGKTIQGMALKRGITLIVGGGFHGKSTLLQAMEVGIYNHIPGDGREFVVTVPDAMKIRAEDGRSIQGVNISPFISNLPYGKDTTAFSTTDGSGSTSQAANIVEALEVGTSCLLLDEDTCATNFMIRDGKMQALVAPEKEPITPFIAKVGALKRMGVSSVLVVGGCGDYFNVADTVVMMDSYVPGDVTEKAQAIAKQSSGVVQVAEFGSQTARRPTSASIVPPTDGRFKTKVENRRSILFGDERIDLSCVEQIVEPSQTRTLKESLFYLARLFKNGSPTLSEALKAWEQAIRERGLDAVCVDRGGWIEGNLAEVRRLELAAALNRLRTLRMSQESGVGRQTNGGDRGAW